MAATDVNGNTATNRYNLTVTGSGSKTLVYDQNGNLTSDGTRTFEWDPLNRLTAVNSGTNRSEFTYNGLSQQVTIVEKDNGAITSTKNLIWIGSEICEERDAGNSVAKRYYPQGMQVGSTNYYYTRDHLGSVRELTNSLGGAQARYDYDPYGRRTKLSGSLDADFGFTGHYYHQPSGLHLALYRAYDADLGKAAKPKLLAYRERSMDHRMRTDTVYGHVRWRKASGKVRQMLLLTSTKTETTAPGSQHRSEKWMKPTMMLGGGVQKIPAITGVAKINA